MKKITLVALFFWMLENDDVTCNPRIMPKIPEISVGTQKERSVPFSLGISTDLCPIGLA